MQSTRFLPLLLLLPLLLAPLLGTTTATVTPAASGDWSSWGGEGHNNDRCAHSERKISPATAGSLQVKWVFEARADVSCTPTVHGDVIYFTDMLSTGGWVYAVHRNGSLLWERSLSALVGFTTLSRNSPTVSGNKLVLGTLIGANVLALDRSNGHLLWIRQISPHPMAIITQSATVYDRAIYVGVSSGESYIAPSLGTCCTFIGSVHKLDLETGHEIWQRSMLPDNGGQKGGYSGAAVWGNMMPVDPSLGRIYLGTGNSYTVPLAVAECQLARVNSSNPSVFPSCVTPDNHQDSMMALDTRDGTIRWARSVSTWDTWNLGCGLASQGVPAFGDTCPLVPGPDYDFTQGPILIDTTIGGRSTRLAVALQKSGKLWAFRAERNDSCTGTVVWVKQVCPGSTDPTFGSAWDGNRIYVACPNADHVPFTLATKPNVTTNGGIWAAYDPSTGNPIWEVADPSASLPLGTATNPGPGWFARTISPLTVANGVVFAGSAAYTGHMYALNAATGHQLLDFASGGSVAAGPSVSDGEVFWPSGYLTTSGWKSNAKVYAFHLPTRRGRLASV